MSGSIASKSSSKKIDDTKEGGCAALGKAMYAIFVAPLAYCFTRTVIGKSIVGDAFGATFNFIVAYALFFGVGVVTFDKYGYDDNTVPADNGSYASGPFGPGSFIITTILFILANVIWISKMVYNFSNNAIYFRAERAAAKQAAQDRRAREQAALHAERMESAKARATATA